MQIKVSIVMPVYNCEKTVERAIKSVIKQNYVNWELIIVDDGSEDKTYNICKEYLKKDCRIKVFHKNNGGPSSARNMALSKITGELLMFIDADDALAPNAIQTLVPFFRNNELDMCIYGWKVDNNGQIKSHYFSKKELGSDKEKIFRGIAYSSNWDMYGGGYPWNKMLRVNKGKNVCFNQQVNILEDRLYILEILDKIKGIKMINLPLYFHIIREESASHSKILKKIFYRNYEAYIATKIEYDYIKKNHPSALICAKKAILQCQINYLMMVKKTNFKCIDNKKCKEVINDFNKTNFHFLNFKYSLKYFYLKLVFKKKLGRKIL